VAKRYSLKDVFKQGWKIAGNTIAKCSKEVSVHALVVHVQLAIYEYANSFCAVSSLLLENKHCSRVVKGKVT
jgi:hypothetical protein